MIEMKLKNNKKIGKMTLVTVLISVMIVAVFSGCIETTDGLTIAPIGRDEASGTREFFWEHVMKKGNFSSEMTVVASNAAIYNTVSSAKGAIGYVGLGYIDENVKVLKIDGVEPTVDTILDGTYPIARDLNMFTNGTATGVVEEYLKFLFSDEGQEIVEEEGFVPVPSTGSYEKVDGLTGSIKVVGSTTVLPIAQLAAEAFNELYGTDLVAVSPGGSSVGVQSVASGAADIGMSSRELKSTEPNLIKHVIATDGIAVIVHPTNTYVDDITLEQLRDIYGGTYKNWNEL